MTVEHRYNDTERGENRNAPRKTCPSVDFPSTKSHTTSLELNLGLQDEMPALEPQNGP
jgi:hypothetical protein